MSVAQMRDLLKNKTKYKGNYTWVTRVNNMSDNQVIAVYKRMERSGEIQK